MICIYSNYALALTIASIVASSAHAFGGTFSQFEACEGKSNVVLAAQGDAGADPEGWFVFSGGMIFCCAGKPLTVLCAEMLVA
jgi:uncharacterized membrane protein